MSKNTLLSELINYVSANASGNVTIAAPSSGYALDVSGTGRFTGQLTLGSTITNGTYTYTLPAATGTLALTSALSAYLPLSGGTLTGALSGTSATFSSNVQLTGDGYVYGNATAGSGTIRAGIRFNSTSQELKFFTADAGRLTIDSAGGATFVNNVFADAFISGTSSISAWGASPVRPIIEGREGNAISNYIGLPEMYYTSNAYYSGTAWVRKSANASINMVVSGYNNNFIVQSAPTGAAGGIVSFSTLFYINGSNGQIGVNTNSPQSQFVVAKSGNNATLELNLNNNGYSRIFSYDRTVGTSTNLVLQDPGGNVGIGVTDPQGQLHINQEMVFSEVGYNTVRLHKIQHQHSDGNSVNNNLRFLVSDGSGTTAERMRINGTGNVLIGTTTDSTAWRASIYNANSNIFIAHSAGYGMAIETRNIDDTYLLVLRGGDGSAIGNRERFKVTSTGKTITSASSSDYTLTMYNSATNAYGMYLNYSGYSPNSTNFEFIYCIDSTNSKFIVWSNGSVVNRTGSYGTISDIKYKENIVDATPKLADLMNLKVRNFNLKGESTKQIGFIAQEFEEVFPNMVDVSTERGMDGETYKSIKTSVLVPMLVKAIQEQQVQINELKQLLNN